ncbi:hypothetical protein FHG87_004565 [Trinorchestia longiramus]|nr:hypothetical protein FHG87_004565 [Trinorchestia longiramus]
MGAGTRFLTSSMCLGTSRSSGLSSATHRIFNSSVKLSIVRQALSLPIVGCPCINETADISGLFSAGISALHFHPALNSSKCEISSVETTIHVNLISFRVKKVDTPKR